MKEIGAHEGILHQSYLYILILLAGLADRGVGRDRHLSINAPMSVKPRTATYQVEFNLAATAAMTLERSGWSGRDELTRSEQDQDPLVSEGVRYGAYLLRYGNSSEMSGTFYGVGFGAGDLKLRREGRSVATYEGQGEFAALRLGYRFCGAKIPILIGFYTDIIHFAHRLNQTSSHGSGDERLALERRFTTDLALGFQYGLIL